MGESSLFTAHYGIKGAPPRYSAADTNPDVDTTLVNFIGIESPSDIGCNPDAWAGDQREPSGWVTYTTVHDRLQASTGPYGPLHTLRCEGPAPYQLRGQHWDEVGERHTLDVVSTPGLAMPRTCAKSI